MTRLVALSSGSAAETRTFDDPGHRAHLAEVSYTGAEPDLGTADAVWVPEGTPRRRLRTLAPRLDAVLDRGGAVLLFGDHQAGWPVSTSWTFRAAGGAGQTLVAGAWAGTEVGVAAAALHHHGVLDPPAGADVLLATVDGAAVAYLDRPQGRGPTMVCTIDPLAHFGHTGSPESARFLAAFLPWVRRLVDGDGR